MHVILTTAHEILYLHLMEEETKTQRGYVSCPRLCQTNRHVTGAHTLYCYATSKTEGKKRKEKRDMRPMLFFRNEAVVGPNSQRNRVSWK